MSSAINSGLTGLSVQKDPWMKRKPRNNLFLGKQSPDRFERSSNARKGEE